MSSETLLSALCSVCNSKEPVYRCPRCSTRTCSLPCYKRHQQRAQCSGQRDPTAFVKSSDLATPAGIDHDFNFLVGIERALDQADRDVQDGTAGGNSNTSSKAQEKAHLATRIQAAGVTVQYAPLGMSRQKANQTRLSNRKKPPRHIVWTVEWKHEDGTQELTDAHETAAVQETYATSKFAASLKRKRELDARTEAALSGKRRASLSEAAPSGLDETSAAGGIGAVDHTSQATHEDSLAALDRARRPDLVHVTGYQERDTVHEIGTQPLIVKDDGAPYRHFYLVKPLTSGNTPVLIPIDAARRLADVLQGQVVIEFPTIQVLSQPASDLPSGFIAEADYLKQIKLDNEEAAKLLASVEQPFSTIQGDHDMAARDEQVGDRELLEVLKKDLRP